jgi:hypothetical protein
MARRTEQNETGNEEYGVVGRMIGDNNEGLSADKNMPMPRGFTGGTDDFYVQFIHRTDGSAEYEEQTGGLKGIHRYVEDGEY